jgi:nucleoside-diphosphate-sugar epimerase
VIQARFEGVGLLFRVTVDSLVALLALMAAFAVRLTYSAYAETGLQPADLVSRMQGYTQAYALTAAPLVALLLAAMALLGVYFPDRRGDRVRTRMFRIMQATALAFLIFGFVVFFLKLDLLFPRAVLLIAYAGTTLGLVLTRAAAALFSEFKTAEVRSLRLHDQAAARHVLVVGGAGYIGPPLIERLLADGCRVRVLDLLLYGGEPIAHVMQHPRFELIRGDFRDMQTVVGAMQDVDAVVHLGGLVGDPACALDEDVTLEINVSATRMIADAARGMGVRRFVFASSCSVYGASDGLLTEDSALNPVSLYARSKIEGEKLLLAMHDERFSPIILRFATIYGLAPRPRFDLVVNLFAAKAFVDGEVQVFGGDQWRPFVHVRDVGEAVRRALFSPLPVTAGRVFNVGSETQNYTISEVAALVQSIVPAASIVSRGEDFDKRDYRVGFDRIRTDLGFEPSFTVEDGIREVVDAIRSRQITDYRNPRYSNILSLKEEGIWQVAMASRISDLYRQTVN